MEITGRITANATVKTVKGDKKVTNFSIAMNRSYKKDGERKEVTTYVDCAYWVNSGVAEFLRKGLLVLLYGDMGVNAWVDRDGKAQGRLTFHTQNIKFLGQSKNATERQDTAGQNTVTVYSDIKPGDDDLPF